MTTPMDRGDLWVARLTYWAIALTMIGGLIFLLVGCTGTGSPCSTDGDSCPTGYVCQSGKCEPMHGPDLGGDPPDRILATLAVEVLR